MNLSVNLQLIGVMLLWAICFPLISIGLPYASHLIFASMRAFLAGAALLLIAIIKKCHQPDNLKLWSLLALTGFFATSLGFFGMFHASEFILPGIATVVANTQPFLATILAVFFLREYVNNRGLLGLMTGFLGILLIALPSILKDSEGYGLGLLYMSVAVLGIAISNVLIRYIANKINPLIAMGWQLIFGSLFLAIVAFWFEDFSLMQWTPTFILSLLLLALPGTALAFWLWCRVLSSLVLAQANSFTFLVPIFGLIFGIVFFNEEIDFLAAVGILLTVLGIFLVNWSGDVTKPFKQELL